MKRLRKLPELETLEIVTRHPRCGHLAGELREAGLDVLKFSLDSLNPEIWCSITGVRGHEQLVSSIEAAVLSGIQIKINMVILRGINDGEVEDMVQFCSQIGASLKILDLITDLPEFPSDPRIYAQAYYDDLLDIIGWLEHRSTTRITTFAPGRLGHPMPTFVLENGVTVTIKTAHSGAWYAPMCKACRHFPCHDALMALRLTSDGKLQNCLLRSDILVDLLTPMRAGAADSDLSSYIESTLNIYQAAEFYPFEKIVELRQGPPTGRKTHLDS